MEKFDVNYIDMNEKEKNKIVKNNFKGIVKFLSTLPKDAILCAENTGSYGNLLVFLSNQLNVKIALVAGYTIKHSSGLIKGKSDPIDAKRIREYGERFFDKLQFTTYDSEELIALKSLYSLRSQYVKSRKLLLQNEHSRSKDPIQNVATQNLRRKSLERIDTEIEEVENEIASIIASCENLKENYDLVQSIKGIGPVIATELIIKTGNFKRIDTARKAASYAGVCPFPNESGKMLGKRKTSPFADKKLKSLLYMGTKSAVKHNKEYKLYYERKELEGKPYFLIMNNVANKMLRTIYAVVKSKIPYSENYICLDPRERINRTDENKNCSEKKVA